MQRAQSSSNCHVDILCGPLNLVGDRDDGWICPSARSARGKHGLLGLFQGRPLSTHHPTTRYYSTYMTGWVGWIFMTGAPEIPIAISHRQDRVGCAKAGCGPSIHS
jgi:hypothetical protein